MCNYSSGDMESPIPTTAWAVGCGGFSVVMGRESGDTMVHDK